MDAVAKERTLFEEKHAALVFATLEKSAELAREYAARVEECARAFSQSGIHDAIELLTRHAAQGAPPAKEEESFSSIDSYSASSSSASDEEQPVVVEVEDDEDEDFVVDDERDVKVYDASFFDKWSTDKFTEKVRGKKRNRKRTRAYSPSKHRNDPMGVVEHLSDEPVEKKDLEGLKEFLQTLQMYEEEYPIMLVPSEWAEMRYIRPLEEIRNNLGTATTNEQARNTFDALLDRSLPQASVEHKRVPGSGKKHCVLCGMLKYCNATLWVANGSDNDALVQCPIGANCAVLAERVIQFHKTLLDHMHDKTITQGTFRAIERAFEGIMDAHEGKTKKK